MLQNRSMPHCTVIPEFAYNDVKAATDWLRGAFGLSVRIAMGTHRAQLNVGDGAIVLTARSQADESNTGTIRFAPSSVLVRVSDVNEHYAQAERFGARIIRAPADYPYGERQYTCEDLAGHTWTFSQSIADVAPEEWGGVAGTSGEVAGDSR